MLTKIGEMERAKIRELSNGIRDGVIDELKNVITMIEDGKPIFRSIMEVDKIGNSSVNKQDSLEGFVQITSHLAGMFGIDFEFLTNVIDHYSVKCESYSESNDEGSYHNEYTIDSDSIINIHLTNGEFLAIRNIDVNVILDNFAPEIILKSFPSNKTLIDKLTSEDYMTIRDKFSDIHYNLKEEHEISLLYLSNRSNNIIGLASQCIYLHEISNAGSRNSSYNDSYKTLHETIRDHLRDIEVHYKKLIYELYSFECEFDILKYIKSNTFSGSDKLPLMRTLLRELIGEKLYNRIKFPDREFYMRLDLTSNNVDVNDLKWNSYTCKLKDLYPNSSLLLLTEFIDSEIMSNLYDADSYVRDQNNVKFSKDGSN